jgi:transposase InsO family protein
MEAVPLSDISREACARALIFSWISHFGVPKTITSDHGPQFSSNVWYQLCEMLNITHGQTTAYHPEANGAVKRLHRRLKDALHARVAAATWAKKLPWVLLGLRAQPREDTALSSAEAVFGTPIVLPNKFFHREELSVDKISKKFLNTLDAPAFPLSSKHNWSRLLP